MPVPFINLARIVARVRDDVLPAWTECLDRCEFVGGPRVGALEKKLAGVLGIPRVVSCANGTDALLIGLQALGVKAGSKVALPNLTFWATFEAIAQLGATPVLVDVDPDDLQVSLEELRSAHEKHRFDAAILVHLFGWTSARLAEIRAFCKERDVALLEDGAQCFGVEAGGEPVLAKADVATLSFYPAKVIGGAMDGGAITLQTEAQEALVRSLCNHGRSDHYSYAHVGWNSRMGGIQAAFIGRVLDEVPEILSSRRAAADVLPRAARGRERAGEGLRTAGGRRRERLPQRGHRRGQDGRGARRVAEGGRHRRRAHVSGDDGTCSRRSRRPVRSSMAISRCRSDSARRS